MRITLVTQHFAPEFEGGTELVARAQARELARRGHDVRIVSGSDQPAAGEERVERELDGLSVTFLPRREDETYDLALERPRLEALLRETTAEADVVHVHHWSTLSGRTVRTLAAARPTVVTLHDLFTTCPRFFRVPVAPVTSCPTRGDWEPCARCCAVDAPGLGLAELEAGLRLRAAAYQAELDAAARIVVPSDAHAQALRAFVELAEARTTTLPHGLCVSFAGGVGGCAPEWSGEGPLRALFLGHRTRVKGVLDLVEALQDMPNVELHLIGSEVEPGFDAELRAAARGSQLRFHDAYRVEELAERVRAIGGAHLALFPSRVSESYGLVVDEALALGLPTWVSDRGAPRERVGTAGRVLPAADPAAWRKALLEVRRAPATLAAQRSAAAAGRRTAADAALELEALYGELLGA